MSIVSPRNLAFLAIAPAMLIGLVGCSPQPTTTGDNPQTLKPFAENRAIRAVCTTGMVADMVRHIGGSRLEVEQIMGEGIDPHLFKATPDVIAKLHAADVIFYSGLHLEGRMTEVLEALGKKKPVVALADGLPPDRLIDAGGGLHDPHVWFDVSLWARTSDSVHAFLVKFDPPHQAEYDANAGKYRDELVKLHDEVRKRFEGIPQPARALVTAHDAFHYFGRAYGGTVKAVQGVSTETEAGVREINDLVKFIVDGKIKAVFVETSVSDRNIRALVEGCKAQGHNVGIGGELFSDSMGKPGTPEGTYVGMVRHNVDTMIRALQ